jgi:hypothetical protein
MARGTWSVIASLLPGRTAKQCRERWYNHLCPDITRGPWTAGAYHLLTRVHVFTPHLSCLM